MANAAVETAGRESPGSEGCGRPGRAASSSCRVTDSLRETARSLARARLRTVLGLIGIAIGIASVIAMVSAGEIATAEARRQFEALGNDIVTVQTAQGYRGPGIRLDDALALAGSLPEIFAMPFVSPPASGDCRAPIPGLQGADRRAGRRLPAFRPRGPAKRLHSRQDTRRS